MILHAELLTVEEVGLRLNAEVPKRVKLKLEWTNKVRDLIACHLDVAERLAIVADHTCNLSLPEATKVQVVIFRHCDEAKTRGEDSRVC